MAIVVIDVETTGLDPSKHACIELGAVLLDQSLNIIRDFGSLVRPYVGASVVGQAMEANRIDVKLLDSAVPIPDVVELLHQFLGVVDGSITLAGWNVWFDVAFLKDMFCRSQRTWPFGHRCIDVQSIAAFCRGMKPCSQSETIGAIFGEAQSHRALDDARHTARLLQYFSSRVFSENSRRTAATGC